MKAALVVLSLFFASQSFAMPSAVSGYNPDPEEPYKSPDSIGSKEQACPTPAKVETSGRMACTMMACVDGLSLQVDPNYHWKPGAYTFTFEAEGKTETCTGSLPLRGCDDGASLNCTATWMQITESGCALPKENQGFGDIWISGWPRNLKVTISRDGKMIASQTITPSWLSSQPNGSGCQPTCCQAATEIRLAP